MCTLTYVPLKSGRVITSNRDESPLRNASVLSPYISKTQEEYFIAEEPLRGGTNTAIGKNNRNTILLNGAFKPHDMTKTYGMSRGIVLLKSLDFQNAFAFADDFLFEKIQPFTLIDFQDTSIREIRWDGAKLHKAKFSVDEPHIWASAQMYLDKAQHDRKNWFERLLKSENLDAGKILDFHFNGGNGDPENDMVMKRLNLVQTVSISQVTEFENKKDISHYDLVNDSKTEYHF